MDKSQQIVQSPYFRQSTPKNDGLGRIRIGGLRRVKAMCFADLRSTHCPNQHDHSPAPNTPRVLSDLVLLFTLDELTSYAERRKYGLSTYSVDWINRSEKAIWDCTHGSISKKTIDKLRLFVLNKYHSEDSHSKVLSFAKAFLKFLTKVRLDTRYCAFEVFLERPRAVKARKNVTSRIITKADIEKVLAYINKEEKAGSISQRRSQQYKAFILLGAYTGQRSLATISKLTVGQFREALRSEKPCIEVQSSQDKIKFAHYCPLHPQVIQAIQPLLEGRGDDETMFEYISLLQWVKRAKIPLTRITSHFMLGDLRKFAEQHGDVIGWEHSNRAYILTYGVSGVEWAHYRHPLPENVYYTYMKSWKYVNLASEQEKD
ncbi:MAG: hypothetical protein ACXV5D_09265 [Halobacteriota archaeon]